MFSYLTAGLDYDIDLVHVGLQFDAYSVALAYPGWLSGMLFDISLLELCHDNPRLRGAHTGTLEFVRCRNRCLSTA